MLLTFLNFEMGGDELYRFDSTSLSLAPDCRKEFRGDLYREIVSTLLCRKTVGCGASTDFGGQILTKLVGLMQKRSLIVAVMMREKTR